MKRIAKLCCLVALSLFALVSAEIPRGEASACVSCSLDDIRACNNYCVSRGCTFGNCRSLCSDWCFCTC
jgi:hypothetical protein